MSVEAMRSEFRRVKTNVLAMTVITYRLSSKRARTVGGKLEGILGPPDDSMMEPDREQGKQN